MGLFESVFDITYLILVISMGIRLLLEKGKMPKSFGIMAIVLGLGDSFHLLPRVISHLSPAGFEGHAFALSWGQFVTSITMTFFYLLYYDYYEKQSGNKNSRNKSVIYVLAILRIILVLMPQNEWGSMPGNYLFGIYRNIPFAVMGALLIYWTYQSRDKKGLKHMSLLIFLSFAFYIPVVLFKEAYPVIGSLMMPKTMAYLMIVVFGYRYFIQEFKASHVLALSFTTLMMGFAGGVFYREFTKFYQYENTTHLGKLHVHSLTLGFLALFMIYLVIRRYDKADLALFRKPLSIYLAGLCFTLVNMMIFGIYEVVSGGQNTVSVKALEGLSGLGHIALSVGLSWLIVRLFNIESEKKLSYTD